MQYSVLSSEDEFNETSTSAYLFKIFFRLLLFVSFLGALLLQKASLVSFAASGALDGEAFHIVTLMALLPHLPTLFLCCVLAWVREGKSRATSQESFFTHVVYAVCAFEGASEATGTWLLLWAVLPVLTASEFLIIQCGVGVLPLVGMLLYNLAQVRKLRWFHFLLAPSLLIIQLCGLFLFLYDRRGTITWRTYTHLSFALFFYGLVFFRNFLSVIEGRFERAYQRSRYTGGIFSSVTFIVTIFVAGFIYQNQDPIQYFGSMGSYLASAPASYWNLLLVNSVTGVAAYCIGWSALAACMQRFNYFFPLLLATPLSVVAQGVMCSQPGAISSFFLIFTQNCPSFLWDPSLAQGLGAFILWVSFGGVVAAALLRREKLPVQLEKRLFFLPGYRLFLDGWLMCNRNRHPPYYTQPVPEKGGCIFFQITLYRETKEEMHGQLLSLQRLVEQIDLHKHEEAGRTYKAHVLFDRPFDITTSQDGNTSRTYNAYSLQLVDLLREELKMSDIKVADTWYGEEWQITMRSGETRMPIWVHLKDPTRIRAGKRWSQIFANTLMIQDLLLNKKSFDFLFSTYVLLLDGDTQFEYEAVRESRRILERDFERSAAVSARIVPIGSGGAHGANPLVWYQSFEYASGQWLQKTAEDTFGSLLCAPGCFTLMKMAALCKQADELMAESGPTNPNTVCPIVEYSHIVKSPAESLMFDQGEDRMLSTILICHGYTLRYLSWISATTHCPEGLHDLYVQRRRWVTSTLANTFALLANTNRILKHNKSISPLFILYVFLQSIGVLFTPAVTLVVTVGGLSTGLNWSLLASFFVCLIIPVVYMCICWYWAIDMLVDSPATKQHKQHIQTDAAFVLSLFYAVLYAAVWVGLFSALALDSFTLFNLEFIFLGLIIASLAIAAILHFELVQLLYGMLYLFWVPSVYILLNIFAFANMNDQSWGTREGGGEGDTKKNQSFKEPFVRLWNSFTGWWQSRRSGDKAGDYSALPTSEAEKGKTKPAAPPAASSSAPKKPDDEVKPPEDLMIYDVNIIFTTNEPCHDPLLPHNLHIGTDIVLQNLLLPPHHTSWMPPVLLYMQACSFEQTADGEKLVVSENERRVVLLLKYNRISLKYVDEEREPWQSGTTLPTLLPAGSTLAKKKYGKPRPLDLLLSSISKVILWNETQCIITSKLLPKGQVLLTMPDTGMLYAFLLGIDSLRNRTFSGLLAFPDRVAILQSMGRMSIERLRETCEKARKEPAKPEERKEESSSSSSSSAPETSEKEQRSITPEPPLVSHTAAASLASLKGRGKITLSIFLEANVVHPERVETWVYCPSHGHIKNPEETARFIYDGYRLNPIQNTTLTSVYARWNGTLLQVVERGLIKNALASAVHKWTPEEAAENVRAFVWVPHMSRFYQVFNQTPYTAPGGQNFQPVNTKKREVWEWDAGSFTLRQVNSRRARKYTRRAMNLNKVSSLTSFYLGTGATTSSSTSPYGKPGSSCVSVRTLEDMELDLSEFTSTQHGGNNAVDPQPSMALAALALMMTLVREVERDALLAMKLELQRSAQRHARHRMQELRVTASEPSAPHVMVTESVPARTEPVLPVTAAATTAATQLAGENAPEENVETVLQYDSHQGSPLPTRPNTAGTSASNYLDSSSYSVPEYPVLSPTKAETAENEREQESPEGRQEPHPTPILSARNEVSSSGADGKTRLTARRRSLSMNDSMPAGGVRFPPALHTHTSAMPVDSEREGRQQRLSRVPASSDDVLPLALQAALSRHVHKDSVSPHHDVEHTLKHLYQPMKEKILTSVQQIHSVKDKESKAAIKQEYYDACNFTYLYDLREKLLPILYADQRINDAAENAQRVREFATLRRSAIFFMLAISAVLIAAILAIDLHTELLVPGVHTNAIGFMMALTFAFTMFIQMLGMIYNRYFTLLQWLASVDRNDVTPSQILARKRTNAQAQRQAHVSRTHPSPPSTPVVESRTGFFGFLDKSMAIAEPKMKQKKKTLQLSSDKNLKTKKQSAVP